MLLTLGRKSGVVSEGTSICLYYTLCLMQLSVACNLIPRGVRMISRGWIFSHRCSWITVYVSCCNAQMNIIVVIMSCLCTTVQPLFVNCPAVICSPNMLFIYFGETPLLNYGPRSILNTDNTNNCNSLFFSIHYKQTPFSTLCI